MLIGLTVFNAVLGLRQESKAEASLAALEKMLKDIARVRRDGAAIEIDAAELVPGDIVLFEAGNRVPADGRLIVAATLEIEEAALTGRERPGAQGPRADRGRRRRPRRPAVPRVHEHVGHPRARRDDRHRHRDEHRDRQHRHVAEPDRGGQDAAAEAAGPPHPDHRGRRRDRVPRDADPRHPRRPRLRRGVPRRGGAGHLGHPDRPARGGHHPLLDGHAGAGRAQRHRQAVAIGRDPRLGVGHLLGQDRHPDPEQDDRSGAGGAGPQPVHDQRRGLRDHGGDQARRRPHVRPRRRAPADGAVRGCPARRRRRPDRRPDRGGADRAGGQGRDRPRRRSSALPAGGGGAVRLRVQVHGDLPPHDRPERPGRRSVLRQGRSRRAHRAVELVLGTGW